MSSMEEAGEAQRADEVNGFTEEQMGCILTQVLGKDSAVAHMHLGCARGGQRVIVRNEGKVLDLGFSDGLYSLRIQGWVPDV